VLDSGPLGMLANPADTPTSREANRWAKGLLAAGDRLIVSAVAHFEVERELIRSKRARSLRRLATFVGAVPGRYLPLEDSDLRLGARLWAEARNRGLPTAGALALDCDALIAAQARRLSASTTDRVIVATENLKHLSLFVDAIFWSEIEP
jgi:predicted nucleic acid-binding protein